MNEKEKKLQKLTTISFVLICITALVIIGEHILLKEPVSLINILIIEGFLLLLSYCGFRKNAFYLFLLVAVCDVILIGCTCFLGVTPIDIRYLLQGLAAFIAFIATAMIQLPKHEIPSPCVLPKIASYATLVLLIASSFIFTWNVYMAKLSTSDASPSIWAVPRQYDQVEEVQLGTLEKITYQTKAYATDQRIVEKSAYVYLPYGYDNSQSYNILYLMHGTGDDESYWLDKNSYNKLMVDRMIALGDIEPLIIVTPSFYVEDDCSDDLDQLTYSFQQELREDLMPTVESNYSTYAVTCNDEGFTASRDHRAFAGLSRGAVTTMHSALCGSLDYFSWFGVFSGSRTDSEEFSQCMTKNNFADYPIHYLYFTSGSFDFALSGQLEDYRSLLETDSRLIADSNTAFDVFPMRYHSTGSWHLALYNFLPLIFTP